MTVKRPQFDAPPLVEAVFDCFVEPSAELLDPRALEDGFFARFSEYTADSRQEWRQFSSVVAIQGGQPAGTTINAQAGVRRWNSERSRGVLIGPGVLALNIVPPYGHFEDHLPHLTNLLEAFLALAKPRRVQWLGHRYINHVVMDLADQVSPAALFTLYPQLSPPRAMTHPAVTVQVEAGQFPEGSVLTSLSLAARAPDKVVYSLDVYARTTGEVELAAGSVAGWHTIAHRAIMDAFLGSITAEARRRFKEKTS